MRANTHPATLVDDFLTTSAALWPDRPASIDVKGTVTYAALVRRADQTANLLLEHGLQRGDRVVLALENSTEWVSCYFGILKAGGIVVPLPRGPKSDRFEHALKDATPRLCVTDHETAAAHAAALGRSTVECVLLHGRPEDPSEIPRAVDLEAARAATPASSPSVRRVDLDLAAIVYTSGSTGAPRGVMLSHLNIRANTESIVSYLRLNASDRVMVVLPFYYVYGLSLLNTHAYAGGCVVIDNRFAFPKAVLSAMREHAVTGFAGVPSTFALLLHRSPIRSMSLPALRYVTQAGGPMAPARIEEWRQVMPTVPFYVMYGATEAAARLAFLEPAELDHRPGSIGRAIPNVELAVRTDDGKLAAPGEIGELVAHGSNISNGYWNDPDATRAAFGPDGYRTGDLAYADADGFLYLVGRRGDMLKVGAHRVGAKEIEDVLQEYPALHEVAVLPEADDLLGEVPIAFVTPRNGQVDPHDVLAFCRTRLPDYKVPSRIIVQEELPKTGAGKIDKRALREALAAAPADWT